MTREEIAAEVRKIIAHQRARSVRLQQPIEITEASRLTDDVGFDSLDMVEFIMAIEERFDFEIPEGEDAHILTVAQVIDDVGGRLLVGDPDADICSVCAKPVAPGSPVRFYDDIGEVHAICGGATPDQNRAGGRITVDPDEFSGEGPRPEYVEVYLSHVAPAVAA